MSNKGRRRGNYNGQNPRRENDHVRVPAKKPEIMPPDMQKVEKDVLKCIIGQDKQVRQLVTSVYRGMNFSTIKSNTLVIGNSGTGKTETIKQIAKRLNKPYTIEDATKYTQEGYYGDSVEKMLYNLLVNADGELDRAQNGILIIDEIDKKTSKPDQPGADVAGVEVLKSLLKIIEGTKIEMEIPIPGAPMSIGFSFDTSKLIVILMGAFPGLDKIRDKRLNKNPMGFGVEKEKLENKKNARYTKQDLVKYGLTEEFVGRIDTIVEMNKLTEENLQEILKTSKLSIFRRYESELRRKGVTLVYYDEIFQDIAKESLTLDTGARELSNTVNYIFENIIYEILAVPEVYCMCELLPGIVEDNTKYVLS